MDPSNSAAKDSVPSDSGNDIASTSNNDKPFTFVYEVIDTDGTISVDSISLASGSSSVNDHTATSVQIIRPVFQAKDFFQPQTRSPISGTPTRTSSSSNESDFVQIPAESLKADSKSKLFTHGFFKKQNKPDDKSSLNLLLVRLFPILSWLPGYSFRNDFFYDLIAGLTVLTLHIPQGLAYGRLAGLEPSNGLYVGLFPALFMVFFSRSRHISIGTFAVISIACRDLLEKFETQDLTDTDDDVEVRRHGYYSALNDEFVPVTPLEVLTSFCLLVGLIQLIISMLRLGVLVNLLSDPIISAFCSAAAVHVMSSQIFSMFDIDSTAGENEPLIPFELVRSWYRFATRLPNMNLLTVILSVTILVILLVVKYWLEPYLMKRFNIKSFTIPIDILVIIMMASLSHFLNFDTNHKVSIIKDIQAGFTSLPTMPRVDIWPPMLTTAILIAFIIYATTYSLEMIYAQKHGYEIDPNEELAALGIANMGSSFFGCFPATGALARSAVQDKVGGRSQIACLVSSGGIVVFILFLTPLLRPLPKCTLACIIVVALISSLMKVTELAKFWRISRFDGALWVISFVAVLLLGIDTGLLAGVIVGLSFLVFRIAFPEFNLKQRVSESECYLERNQHSPCPVKERSDVLVFEFVGPLIFLNAERFKRQFKTQIIDPVETEYQLSGHLPMTIVFDCSRISFVDNKAALIILELRKKLRPEVSLLIAGCNRVVFETLDRCQFFDRFSIDQCYLTVYDAIVAARMKNGLNPISGTNFSHSSSNSPTLLSVNSPSDSEAHFTKL